MAPEGSCEGCAHWRRLSAYRGECRQAAFNSTTYRLVGSTGIDSAEGIFEETKPTYLVYALRGERIVNCLTSTSS